MAQKQQYQTIKRGRRVTPGLAVVVVLAVTVVVLGCIAAFFAAAFAVDAGTAAAGVNVQIGVVGNDVVVEVLGGERISELRYLYLIIDGVALPDSIAAAEFDAANPKIPFAGAAHGVNGVRKVGVRGYFGDDQTHMLLMKEIRFS
ncbi:MAG: hypothetical protein Q4Q04_05715 [Methanocorpusculum sp.]|nr:hypothetical protein [Methanocorpusculum sp.]